MHLDFKLLGKFADSGHKILGDRPTVGHAALDRRIGVRIPVAQLFDGYFWLPVPIASCKDFGDQPRAGVGVFPGATRPYCT